MKTAGILFVALGLSLLTVDAAVGAQQAIADKSSCKHVGGKVTPNPWSTGEYPYLCTYADKYDRKCQQELDESAYYDVVQRKCVSEMCEDGFC